MSRWVGRLIPVAAVLNDEGGWPYQAFGAPGLTCVESRPSYRIGPSPSQRAEGSEERGKRELWKATVDLDATD